MKSLTHRRQSMVTRSVPVLVAVLGSLAHAQSDTTAPPLVTADEPPQYQQPQYQQPQYQQPQYQQPQYQQPQYQQPQYQQPQYQQPQPQQPQYQQPQAEQPQAQQPSPQQPAAKEGFFTSTRSKHFLAIASGSVGASNTGFGGAGNLRGELDISRFALLAGYTVFSTISLNSFVHQFNAMGGFSFFSSDRLTLRALLGVDVMTRDNLTAVGPVFGTNIRAGFGKTAFIGLDGALMITPFPFRQFEARAALVLRLLFVEFHLGWRIQAIDATQSGTLETLLNVAPIVNGPMLGVGLTF